VTTLIFGRHCTSELNFNDVMGLHHVVLKRAINSFVPVKTNKGKMICYNTEFLGLNGRAQYRACENGEEV